jgi:hypothetical protein
MDVPPNCKMFFPFLSFQIDEDDECLSTDIPSLVEDFLRVGIRKDVK